MSNQASQSCDGFTLVEVLVALSILSVGLAALLPVFSTDLERIGENDATAQASDLLQTVVAELGTTIALQPGIAEGEFSETYHWHVEMTPYGTRDDQDAWPATAYAVSASVVWQDGQRQRAISVKTLRIGPKETFK